MVYPTLKEYFSSKTALVTGAASGIGKDVAEKLHELGAKVIAVDIDKKGLESLKADKPDIEIIKCDLSNWKSVNKKLETACQNVDLLVNSAGLMNHDFIEEIKERDTKDFCKVDMIAPIQLIKLVSKGMKERKFGSIVNVSSLAAIVAFSGSLVYSAGKAGVDMTTKVAAVELGEHNIRVNSVNPTVTETKFANDYYKEHPDEKEKDEARIGRFAQVKDVTNAVIFLLSDNASFVTSATLAVDCRHAFD